MLKLRSNHSFIIVLGLQSSLREPERLKKAPDPFSLLSVAIGLIICLIDGFSNKVRYKFNESIEV